MQYTLCAVSANKNFQDQHREGHSHDATRIVAIVVAVALMLSFAAPFVFAGL
ncbi:hypothetical protein PG2109B_0624 [Bifidobacterium pseudolongum subsp. globosum]|nr:hypothetical protein PG2109B_0624 [Bifidobacterium pseudolongum subsp. globosum]